MTSYPPGGSNRPANTAPWERIPPGMAAQQNNFNQQTEHLAPGDIFGETERIQRPYVPDYTEPHNIFPDGFQPDWRTVYEEEEGSADPETPEKANSRLLASSGSIAVATLTSRITGFLKSTLLLAVLGGSVASSYTVAAQIPNMISEFVLGAVLTAIVVPVLVRAEREDEDAGAAFVRRLFTAAVTVLAFATVAALAAAPLLMKLFLSQNGKVSSSLTLALSYLLLPAILFYGMSALLMAILNTRQVFKPGAWAPVLNNLVVLVVLGIYYLMPGQISDKPVRMSDPHLLVLGVGLTLGVVVQLLTLVPAIRREGIDLRPLWGVDARLRHAAGMGLAIILYVGISQAGLVFGTHISSAHDDAGPAIYQNTWMLLQLPYGVLGVTLLTAIMPRLSRNAAADDTPAVVDDLSVATRLTMIALIPIVLFMTLSGKQIGEALFGHGNFGFHDAGRLGEATSWSAFTLIPYALVLIHLRVFYAREQAWTPTWIILGITSVKIVLSALVPLVVDDEHVVIGLGVANGIAFVVGAIIGGFLLHRSLGDLRMANVGRTVWRVIAASAVGGGVMYAVDHGLKFQHMTDSMLWVGSLIRVIFGAIVMLGIAFAIMWVAGIEEVVGVTVALLRRLGLTKSAPIEAPASKPAHRPYDPLMDAETMILPVIRANAVDTPGVGEFPYPVRQRDFGSTTSACANEGARVSDDAVTGFPTGRRDAGPGSTGTVPPNVAAAADALGDRLEPHVVPQSEPHLEHHHEPEPGPPPVGAARRGPQLIPGGAVAGGRYRLLAPHGGARGLVFWQALDIKLDREVALTFVDADQRNAGDQGPNGPQAILSRTLRLGRISSSGLARVLDVVRGSSGGIVVSEWTPGRSLREMAETRPSPIGAARAIASLAAATELAHRSGGALSIDHPDRVRISVAGDAVLAFPATLADADVQSDVRGLGAMLYALILARWPIGAPSNIVTGTAAPSTNVGGLRPADFSQAGVPVEPRAIRPEVPFEISAVAVRALEPNQGVRTAATLQHVLEQASVVDQKTEMLPSLRVGQRAQLPGHTLSDEDALAEQQAKSKRMMLILAALGALIVIVLGLVGWWLANVLAGGGGNTPLSSAPIGLTTSNSAVAGTVAPAEPTTGPALHGVPIPIDSISVFSPTGTADNASSARNVLDNNPSTDWHTDTYFQQFPALKSGIGLLAALPNAAKLTGVWINSPSDGTQVEIRTSPTESPTLDQTQVIGRATLSGGTTNITVKSDQSAHYVLIWITKLAQNGGQYQTTINDLGLTATA